MHSGTHDSGRSGVWSRPGQTQGEDERCQWGVWSDSLHSSMLGGLRGGQMTAGRRGHSPAFLFLLVYTFVVLVSFFAITKLGTHWLQDPVLIEALFLFSY